MEEFTRLSTELAGLPRLLCHRDYHVRNLMLKDGKIYIIDFQDARQGPPSYDVVSLLKDSIELDHQEVDEYRDYYLSRASSDSESGGFSTPVSLNVHSTLAQGPGNLWLPDHGARQCSLSTICVRFASAGAPLLASQVPEFPYIQRIVEGSLTQ